MSLAKHAAFLIASLVLSGHAQAQFKGVAEPMPAMPAPPMAVPAPVTAPDLGAATAPITSAPSVAPEVDAPAAAPAAAPETTGAIPATTPTAMVPGCPEGPDCPPEPEGEGPFSEAVKEMLKEFAKCEADGKSLETCLSDDPPPPHLSQLTQEDRAQLVQCLGSSDLSATKELWPGCLVGAD
jgi:hypothetical protein